MYTHCLDYNRSTVSICGTAIRQKYLLVIPRLAMKKLFPLNSIVSNRFIFYRAMRRRGTVYPRCLCVHPFVRHFRILYRNG